MLPLFSCMNLKVRLEKYMYTTNTQFSWGNPWNHLFFPYRSKATTLILAMSICPSGILFTLRLLIGKYNAEICTLIHNNDTYIGIKQKHEKNFFVVPSLVTYSCEGLFFLTWHDTKRVIYLKKYPYEKITRATSCPGYAHVTFLLNIPRALVYEHPPVCGCASSCECTLNCH